MDTNQPAMPENITPASSSPVMLATKTPSATLFIIAVLLFLMPFVDIKCGGMKLQDVKGFELATGFNLKSGGSDMPLFDEANTPGVDRTITKTDRQQPNMFALVALVLAVAGAGLCFVNNKMAIAGTMAAGVLSVASLAVLYFDIKHEVKTSLAGKPDDIGGEISEGLKDLDISVDFTPWFYITIVALLAATFFCYKRLQTLTDLTRYKKIFSIVLSVALIVCFFLPLYSGVFNFSAFDLVKAPSRGADFNMLLFKYLWLFIPISGLMLVVGALNNGNYILGRGLWAILPLLTILFYIFGWPLINNVPIGDIFKGFGEGWGIGMWLAVIASLAAAFYHPKAKA